MDFMETIGTRVKSRRNAMGMSQEDLAKEAGVSQATIDKIENDRTQKSKFLPEVFAALDLPLSTLKTPQGDISRAVGFSPLASKPSNMTPIFGTAEGGNGNIQITSDPVEFIPTPHALINVRGAYCVIVSGESMVPSFRPGQLALVHPYLPPRPGEDVILYQDHENGDSSVIIKHLVKVKSDCWVVEQYNPAKTIELKRSQWAKCHVVIQKYNKW